MEKFDLRDVTFYVIVSLVVALLLWYSFHEDLLSATDRVSLFWLQKRGLGTEESEYVTN